jgi:hypothetical protein
MPHTARVRTTLPPTTRAQSRIPRAMRHPRGLPLRAPRAPALVTHAHAHAHAHAPLSLLRVRPLLLVLVLLLLCAGVHAQMVVTDRVVNELRVFPDGGFAPARNGTGRSGAWTGACARRGAAQCSAAQRVPPCACVCVCMSVRARAHAHVLDVMRDADVARLRVCVCVCRPRAPVRRSALVRDRAESPAVRQRHHGLCALPCGARAAQRERQHGARAALPRRACLCAPQDAQLLLGRRALRRAGLWRGPRRAHRRRDHGHDPVHSRLWRTSRGRVCVHVRVRVCLRALLMANRA